MFLLVPQSLSSSNGGSTLYTPRRVAHCGQKIGSLIRVGMLKSASEHYKIQKAESKTDLPETNAQRLKRRLGSATKTLTPNL